MIELRDWIISHYFVSLQIVNQWTLKKLCKIKDEEMQWTKKLDPSRRTTHRDSSPIQKAQGYWCQAGVQNKEECQGRN